MAKYSELPCVDEGFSRWVREEDPPRGLYPELTCDDLRTEIERAEPLVRVHRSVEAAVEHSAVALAVKATKLAPGLLYAQLNVYLSRFCRAAFLSWEWRRDRAEKEPHRDAEPPVAPERARVLASTVAGAIARAGVPLVPAGEARRVVRVTDDPFYDGEYYEITVFEALFGMGYPERQR